MAFKCERCGDEFPYKSRLINHLTTRKKPCPSRDSNIDIHEYIKRIEDDEFEKKKYSCKYCNKRFLTAQTKYIHQKKCIESIVEKEPIDEKSIENLTNELNALKIKMEKYEKFFTGTSISNSQNANVINNNNIQINVKDFGINENKDYLDHGFLLECFRDMNLCKVLKEVHFNPDHPENHNVRLKNQRQNLMEYKHNGEWIIEKKEIVLYDLIMNGYRVLNTYYRNNKSNVDFELEDDEINESLSWLKKIYNEDKTLMKELKNDALLLVMNNKALLLQKC